MKHIKEFLTGKVIYDKGSNMFFVNSKDDQQMVLDMRGWGHIQNMFRDGQNYDLDAAAEYQDRIGEFIAEAINEKMEREFTDDFEVAKLYYESGDKLVAVKSIMESMRMSLKEAHEFCQKHFTPKS